MANAINEAIDELLKDYKKALAKAVKYASDKAVDDIYRKSMSLIDDYYENYEPTHYDRSDSLWNCVVPYLEIKHNNKNITSTVGVLYDAATLQSYIEANNLYNGSKKYRPVDASWVINNYLAGIHPATDGSSTPDEAYYYEIIDNESPTKKMNEYLNKYVRTTFQDNLLVSFAKQILKTK